MDSERTKVANWGFKTVDGVWTIRWGIMATGGIAETFTKDLLTNPKTRHVHDVQHELAAVASSTSSDRAASFVKKVDGPSTTTCYGSYADLVADENIDIIYVATPHSHHFQNAMLALEANKHVLCEKSLTVTSAQAKKLVETARKKQLFLMEAVWTRFFPQSIEVRKLIRSGDIGKVYRVIADFSFNHNDVGGKLKMDDSSRDVNKDLAGGALLDLGIYSLTWVFQTLYHLQSDDREREAPKIMAAINQYHTGVDETTSIICQFPQHKAMGIALTSFRAASDPDGHKTAGPPIRIQGSEGEIQVFGSAPRPSSIRIIKKTGKGLEDVEEFGDPCPKDPERGSWGHGMYWEADECARCLRNTYLESDTMPLDESVAIIEAMEQALRQGGVTYPELITSDVYDAQSPLNTGKK